MQGLKIKGFPRDEDVLTMAVASQRFCEATSWSSLSLDGSSPKEHPFPFCRC